MSLWAFPVPPPVRRLWWGLKLARAVHRLAAQAHH